MPYEELSKLFYKDGSQDRYRVNSEKARERLSAESTFRSGIVFNEDELFLAMPRELSVIIERVLRRERKASAAFKALPPIARGAFTRSLIIDEVVCSNGIEGVRSTRRQVSDVLDEVKHGDSTDGLQSKRFKEFAKLYLGLSEKTSVMPHSPEDIRGIYDLLMAGEDLDGNTPDGRLFRKDPVDIIDGRGRTAHSGVNPERRIIEMVESMLSLQENEEVPQICSAVMAHYVFEAVHPFYDGNGRTGRYLLALALSDPLSVSTALSLSRVIAENKESYYQAFKTVQHPMNHGELTFFVMRMLEYVLEAQANNIERLELGRGQMEGARSAARLAVGSDEVNEKGGDLLFMFAQVQLFGWTPEVLLADAANYLSLSPQMARKHLKTLEEKGLIETLSQRPLKFQLSARGRGLMGLLEGE